MVRTRSQILALKNTFHAFPSLPPEIRLLIWELSLPTTPQLIPHSILRIPAIAYACQESRSIYKQHYTTSFKRIEAETLEKAGPVLEYPMALNADLSKDILFISWDLFEGSSWELNWKDWMTSEAIERIKHIAIDADMWRDLDPEYGGLRSEDEAIDFRKQILELPNLKTFTLVFLELVDAKEWWQGRYDEEDGLEAFRTRDGWKKEYETIITTCPEDDVLIDDTKAFLDDLEEECEGWEAPEFKILGVKETKRMADWLGDMMEVWVAGGIVDTVEENYTLVNKYLDA